jgi:nucleotide-binding universal stress UspA family protein
LLKDISHTLVNVGDVMYTKILVPIDGSVHSQHALSVACKLSEQNSTKVYVLHIPEVVGNTTKLIWGVGALASDATSEHLASAGEALLEEAETFAKAKGIRNIETMIEQGRPVDIILEVSRREGVDVIVMGSRGLSDLGGMVAGSVSHKVGHLAQCGVITVS